MPNFITVDRPVDNITLAVKDLTKDEAEEFGELMKTEFIKHWKKKQTQWKI